MVLIGMKYQIGEKAEQGVDIMKFIGKVVTGGEQALEHTVMLVELVGGIKNTQLFGRKI
jgi:hypothetical protein